MKLLFEPGDDLSELWKKYAPTQRELEAFDREAFRILPVVHLRYSHLNEEEFPVLKFFKGVRNQLWAENTLFLDMITPVLSKFRSTGFDFTLMKGISLLAGYYSSLGLRRIGDVDILVSRKNSRDAWEFFVREGFKVTSEYRSAVRETLLTREHGVNLEFPKQDKQKFAGRVSCKSLDLHWHALHHYREEKWDADLISDREEVSIGGNSFYIMGPTSLLLTTVLHGSSIGRNAYCSDGEIPPLKWICDAVNICRARGADIDWPRFIRLARECRGRLQLAHRLDYLRRLIDFPVLEEVVRHLDQGKPSRMEWHHHVCTSQLSSRYSPLWRWRNYLSRWLKAHDYRAFEKRNAFAFAVGFLIESFRAVPNRLRR